MAGEVVGINTAIIQSGQGIGFAIPASMARGIIQQLKQEGEVTRGWLGVGIQDLTDDMVEYYNLEDTKGVLVVSVYKGDPADKGGIRPNDIILSLDGRSVSTGRELSKAIAAMPVSKKVKIVLVRDGKKKKITVKLGKRDDEKLEARQETASVENLGLNVVPLEPRIAKQFGFGEDEKGVFVAGVELGSSAHEAGIREGDLIKEINHIPTETVKDFMKLVGKIEEGESVGVLIRRRGAGLLVTRLTR
jgi:serine protease Do